MMLQWVGYDPEFYKPNYRCLMHMTIWHCRPLGTNYCHPNWSHQQYQGVILREKQLRSQWLCIVHILPLSAWRWDICVGGSIVCYDVMISCGKICVYFVMCAHHGSNTGNSTHVLSRILTQSNTPAPVAQWFCPTTSIIMVMFELATSNNFVMFYLSKLGVLVVGIFTLPEPMTRSHALFFVPWQSVLSRMLWMISSIFWRWNI